LTHCCHSSGSRISTSSKSGGWALCFQRSVGKVGGLME
jgi:hypothetical protein